MHVYKAYKKSGELFDTFNSLKEAAEVVGGGKGTIEHICDAAKGRLKTCRGYIWKKELVAKQSKYFGVGKCGNVYKAYTSNDYIIGYYINDIEASRAYDCYVVNNNLNELLNWPRLRDSYTGNQQLYINKYKLRIG